MGKNAIVGQSGGPTSVINASLAGVFESCKNRGADIVYGMCNGVAGLLEERVVDLSTVLTDDLDIELLKRTPSSFLGSCRYKLPDWHEDETVYKKLFAILEKLNIGYFFYIGGNDSMDTIGKLADYGQRVGSDIRFMGVPKTIDNDLMVTDHTPGYGSAAKYIGVVMKEIIRDAIEAELARGGQVYFVHNRVEDLVTLQGLITRLCPKARVAVGHGKMPAEQLEKLIMDFIYGEFDVLVSTTIVENGIDIPNANTIIVDNAQNFGLSDLHQLRGRVGRSNQKAYCYLLSPPEEMLSSDARRRLRAIEEFSDLGSGFNIAMQDLDIRGAGNLLGAEQSGFIADIGFETYQKIMNEAVAELRAEGLHVPGLSDDEQEVVEQMRFIDDAHIDIEVEAALPDAYVAQQAERLKLYRELDSTKDEEALQAFESRLADRFGPLPRAAKELLNVVRLRWEAIRLGMERVKVKNGLMIVHFVGEENSPFYKSEAFMTLLQRVTKHPDRFVLKQHNNSLAMTVRNVKDVEDAYKTLQQL